MPVQPATLEALRDVLASEYCMIAMGGNRRGRKIEYFTQSPLAHVAPSFPLGQDVFVPEARARGMSLSELEEVCSEWNRVWIAQITQLPDPDAAIALAVQVCDQEPGQPRSRSNIKYDYRSLWQYLRWYKGKGPRPPEDAHRLYCSEWAMLWLLVGGIPLAGIEATPIEVMHQAIYCPDYWQVRKIHDEPIQELPGFNAWPPELPLSETPVLI